MKLNVVDRSGASATVECAPGQSLMSALREKGYPLQAICGGAASCATCHVYVESPWRERLPARGEFEEALVEDTYHFRQESSRLSCQIDLTDALDGLAVIIAPED
ncbi:MAG TPA: 2Fe-2S iron-sulfur cluster-binding protein [Terricaulis sp.]|jgi:Ferredoxin|nr:2Fe-2S iron-sulfur cluster-binding protein [Terricaulis sp.]